MIISFSRTGGFVPINLRCRVDTGDLPPEEAKRLEMLLENSGVMETTGRTVRGNDMHYFTVEIDRDGQVHRARFDQVSIPAAAKPFFDYLLAKCHTQQHDEMR